MVKGKQSPIAHQLTEDLQEERLDNSQRWYPGNLEVPPSSTIAPLLNHAYLPNCIDFSPPPGPAPFGENNTVAMKDLFGTNYVESINETLPPAPPLNYALWDPNTDYATSDATFCSELPDVVENIRNNKYMSPKSNDVSKKTEYHQIVEDMRKVCQDQESLFALCKYFAVRSSCEGEIPHDLAQIIEQQPWGPKGKDATEKYDRFIETVDLGAPVAMRLADLLYNEKKYHLQQTELLGRVELAHHFTKALEPNQFFLNSENYPVRRPSQEVPFSPLQFLNLDSQELPLSPTLNLDSLSSVSDFSRFLDENLLDSPQRSGDQFAESQRRKDGSKSPEHTSTNSKSSKSSRGQGKDGSKSPQQRSPERVQGAPAIDTYSSSPSNSPHAENSRGQESPPDGKSYEIDHEMPTEFLASGVPKIEDSDDPAGAHVHPAARHQMNRKRRYQIKSLVEKTKSAKGINGPFHKVKSDLVKLFLGQFRVASDFQGLEPKLDHVTTIFMRLQDTARPFHVTSNKCDSDDEGTDNCLPWKGNKYPQCFKRMQDDLHVFIGGDDSFFKEMLSDAKFFMMCYTRALTRILNDYSVEQGLEDPSFFPAYIELTLLNHTKLNPAPVEGEAKRFAKILAIYPKQVDRKLQTLRAKIFQKYENLEDIAKDIVKDKDVKKTGKRKLNIDNSNPPILPNFSGNKGTFKVPEALKFEIRRWMIDNAAKFTLKNRRPDDKLLTEWQDFVKRKIPEFEGVVPKKSMLDYVKNYQYRNRKIFPTLYPVLYGDNAVPVMSHSGGEGSSSRSRSSQYIPPQ